MINGCVKVGRTKDFRHLRIVSRIRSSSKTWNIDMHESPAWLQVLCHDIIHWTLITDYTVLSGQFCFAPCRHVYYDENVLQFEAYTAFKQVLSNVRTTAKNVLKSFQIYLIFCSSYLLFMFLCYIKRNSFSASLNFKRDFNKLST